MSSKFVRRRYSLFLRTVNAIKAVIISLTLLFGCASGVQAQGVKVSGLVKDSKSGETLPYVSVAVMSTGKGASSNVDGYFTLHNVPTDTSTIVIKSLGYVPLTYKLTPDILSDIVVLEIEPTSVILKAVDIEAISGQTVSVSEDVSVVSMNPAQLSKLPNLGEVDVFRSLQLMPGISGSNDASSGLYVRGGTPDQNLVLIDGITVYHVDHFFGIFSAFNAESIKDVKVYKGGFGAKHGGRISSVVDMTAKSGNTKKPSVGIGGNLLSANGIVEVPFLKNKASFLLAGRRSYTDILESSTYTTLFDNVAAEDETEELGFGILGGSQAQPEFYFYDINSKLTFRPTEKDVITFSLFNSLDDLRNVNEINLGTQFNSSIVTTDSTNWGNTGYSAKYSRKWSQSFYSNITAAYSNYFSDYSFTTETQFDTIEFKFRDIQQNDVKDFSIRLDNEWDINEEHKVSFGAMITNYDIKYDYILDDSISLQDIESKANLSSLYLEDVWQPSGVLTVKPGIRASYYNGTNKPYFEPRLSAQYNLTENIKLKGAWGRYYQFVNRVILENVLSGSRDFWLMADTGQLPVVNSYHYIFGAAYENDKYLFDVEGYHKTMDGLLEYSLRFGTLTEQLDNSTELYFQGSGVAQGIDVLLQKKTGLLKGWLSYSLARVTHTFPEINQGKSFPALHDQRHEAKLVAMTSWKNFDISAVFVYATGKPYTAPVGQYFITLLDGRETSLIHVGDKNNSRLPNYHRADFSVSYNFKVKEFMSGNAGISFFNIYNRENIKYKRFQLVEFDPDTFQPITPQIVTSDVLLLGFVPNFFLKLKF